MTQGEEKPHAQGLFAFLQHEAHGVVDVATAVLSPQNARIDLPL